MSQEQYRLSWTPRTIDPALEPLPGRIREKFTYDPETGCWNWLTPAGLGKGARVRVGERTHSARRYIAFLCDALDGAPLTCPDGMADVLISTCHEPQCVSPGHVRLGTRQEATGYRRLPQARKCGRGLHWLELRRDIVWVGAAGGWVCRDCRDGY